MATIQHIFPSYEHALSACGKGYDDDEIAVIVARKTAAVIPVLTRSPLDPDPLTISALAVNIARTGDKTIKVLDIGGACGYHYFAIKSLIADIPLSWAVVETPAMVRQASAITNDGSLRFFTSIDAAMDHLGGCDLVHASGTVQYAPEPEQMLDRIVALTAPIMLIARFPIFSGARTVGIQSSMLSHNGPGPMPSGMVDKKINYPITFLNKDYVGSVLLKSYSLISQFLSPSSNYLVGNQHASGASLLMRHL